MPIVLLDERDKAELQGQIADTAKASVKYVDSEVENLKNSTEEAVSNIIAATEAMLGNMYEIKADKEYVNNTFANAITDNVSGSGVSIRDISPVEHILNVKVTSKNLIPYPFTNSTSTINGVTFTDNGDGTITANGTPTENAVYYFRYDVSKPLAFPRGVYTLSGAPVGSAYETYYISTSISLNGADQTVGVYNEGRTFELDAVRAIAIVVKKGNKADNLVFKPQLELGTEATPYTPYVANLSAVSLYRYGGNILPYPYYYTSRTLNGVTFTVNEDTSITMKGTATANTYFYLMIGKNLGASSMIASTNTSATNGEYVLSKWLMYYAATKETYIYIPSGTVVDETIYPQLCKGTVLPPYEPPKEPALHITNADGTVVYVRSIYPTTTLIPTTDGVVIDAEYIVDTKKYIDNKIAEYVAAKT